MNQIARISVFLVAVAFVIFVSHNYLWPPESPRSDAEISRSLTLLSAPPPGAEVSVAGCTITVNIQTISGCATPTSFSHVDRTLDLEEVRSVEVSNILEGRTQLTFEFTPEVRNVRRQVARMIAEIQVQRRAAGRVTVGQEEDWESIFETLDRNGVRSRAIYKMCFSKPEIGIRFPSDDFMFLAGPRDDRGRAVLDILAKHRNCKP